MVTKFKEDLKIDEAKCTGCMSCVTTCSFAHTKKFSMTAKIGIHKDKYHGIINIQVCRQCEESPCLDACPTGALTRDPATGGVVFSAEECIGCKQCVDVCPYDGIHFNEDENIIELCDLCGGDPACVKACTTGALTFGE